MPYLDTNRTFTKNLKGVLVRWTAGGCATLGLATAMTLGTLGVLGVSAVVSAQPALAASCDSPVGSLGGWVWVPPQYADEGGAGKLVF